VLGDAKTIDITRTLPFEFFGGTRSAIQPGRSLPGIHPHSVWRDRTADYGGIK
jgi:hypothetical protein